MFFWVVFFFFGLGVVGVFWVFLVFFFGPVFVVVLGCVCGGFFLWLFAAERVFVCRVYLGVTGFVRLRS